MEATCSNIGRPPGNENEAWHSARQLWKRSLEGMAKSRPLGVAWPLANNNNGKVAATDLLLPVIVSRWPAAERVGRAPPLSLFGCW